MFLRVLILAAFITSAVTPMEAAEQSIGDTGRRIGSTPTPTPHRKKKSRKKRSPSASPVRVKKKTASPSPSQEEEKSPSPFTVRDRVATNSGSERSGSTNLNGFPVTQPDARAAKISVAA